MQKEQLLNLLRKSYDIGAVSLEFLRDAGGTTYTVEGAEGRYLLKVIGGAFEGTASQSVPIMRYLEQQGFPVPETTLTKEGQSVLEAELDGQRTQLILQTFIDGEEPNRKLRAEEVGALVGRLHALLNEYPGELGSQDYAFFIGRYLELLRKKGYPRLGAYTALGKKLWERVKDLPIGNCHGDLHRGNLLEARDGTIYLLDFDTVCRAPIMFDVMVMCDMTDYFHLKPEDIQTTRDVYERFLTGYTEYRPLNQAERRSFYDWVAIRHFQLQATIVEIYGIDCIDESFIDMQLAWLESWLQAIEAIQ